MITEKNAVFHLQTKSASYIFTVTESGKLLHRYFGRRVSALKNLGTLPLFHWSNYDADQIPYDIMEAEYPFAGHTDFRTPACIVENGYGNWVCDFSYKTHRVLKEKPAIPGLPSSVDDEGESETLLLTLQDKGIGAEIDLYYTIFPQSDILCRRAVFRNVGKKSLVLKKCMSASLGFYGSDYELVSFHGAWTRERIPERRELIHGTAVYSSHRGNSSHQQNPFFLLCDKDTNEVAGDAYSFSLVYSGNFSFEAEVDQYGGTRINMGVDTDTFERCVKPGEAFYTPECVMGYSCEGFGALSRNLNDFAVDKICRSPFKRMPRPVAFNSWEATYFDYDEKIIHDLIDRCSGLGIEVFVLDDGWYAERTTEDRSLGDWFENKNRFPGGIRGLVEYCHKKGMRFGLWFEPEMVNENSDLYRAHPDWVVHVPNLTPAKTREQWVLDLRRADVRSYLIERLKSVISQSGLDYIKWDMNRHISDMPAPDFNYDYYLGLYAVLQEVTSAFPEVLFESCSGGGGRFDLGMLYYMPQCWTSDNTDALDRLRIQYSTSFGYPVSMMDNNISAVPNHQTGRVTPLSARAAVALYGVYGCQLDLDPLSGDELKEIIESISFYKGMRDLVVSGDFYRMGDPWRDNCVAFSLVSKDKTRAVVTFFRILQGSNTKPERIKLRGLEPEALYKAGDKTYGGDELMYYGIDTDLEEHDFSVRTLLFERV